MPIVLLPNQLFAEHPDEWNMNDASTVVYLYEHPVFFTKYSYHKLKLVYHRATMKNYEHYLRKKYKCTVRYIEYHQDLPQFSKSHRVLAYDPVDHFVKRIPGAQYTDNPLFILRTREDITAGQKAAASSGTSGVRYAHDKFYRWMRKRYNILMNSSGKPIGGKFSYDDKNRKPFPANAETKYNYRPTKVPSTQISEAQAYVRKHFADNPGEMNCLFMPLTHASAKRYLSKFITERLSCFGPYEDAVHSNIVFGCHSVLSAAMNIGLLHPMEVIEAVLAAPGATKAPLLHSVEGFIRQILGWREYVHMLYVTERKRFEPTTCNYFNAHRKLNRAQWYDHSKLVGIPPIDDLIDKALKYSYLHHIERLMFIGGFLLICGIHPREVHDWFISIVSIDAYHWVMYPNVYGMSQFSAGPIMMTRPYFSSSAYIMRMSNYTKNTTDNWADIWNSLYYNFIDEHKTVLRKNYAIAMQVKNWERKSPSEKKDLKSQARAFL